VGKIKYAARNPKQSSPGHSRELAVKFAEKSIMNRNVRTLLKLTATTTAALGFGWMAEAQVVVSPANMQGWSFFSLNDTYTGPQAGSIGQMVTGPGTPPLGTGSAELSTTAGGGGGGVGITTGAFDGTLLSSITSLSYDAYSAVNNGQQFPYLALNVNLNDGSGNQDTLFFEPPYQTPAAGGPGVANQGPTVMNEWQPWNAEIGSFWDNNNVLGSGGYNEVGTLATFETAYPLATIADSTAPYSFIDGVTLQVGFGSDGDTFTGYVDDVTIGTASGSTTYDFEPSPVPEPTTLALAGLGGLLMLRPRKK
jgi:hypothetical protein